MLDLNETVVGLESQSREEYRTKPIEEIPYFSVEEMILGLQCPDDSPEILNYPDIRGV